MIDYETLEKHGPREFKAALPFPRFGLKDFLTPTAFRELYPTHPRFNAVVVPAVGHMVVPILETPDGRRPIEEIRDGDVVLSALGNGRVGPAVVEKVMVNPYRGEI